MSLTRLRGLALAAAVLVLLSAALPARAEDKPQPATMSLTGTAEVAARPDTATITSGVVSEAKTARAALDANNKAMAEVVAAMKAAGIAEKDLQTSNFSVSPVYYHPPEEKDGRRPPPRIVGYRVANQLAVRVRDLAKLGEVLDAAVSLGANQVGGISFSVADDETLLDEARKQAMADAIRKAQLYAQAAGVKLKRVLSISETGAMPPPRPLLARAMKMEGAAAVPIEAGELSLSAEVNVTWEIEQ